LIFDIHDPDIIWRINRELEALKSEDDVPVSPSAESFSDYGSESSESESSSESSFYESPPPPYKP
jgi:hypothetical protein